ncbi:MAG: FAD-dependent oxidoreductase [Bacillota bacterium]|nr:FAD-dependent oxidoreductase [Bacillota bacterium]
MSDRFEVVVVGGGGAGLCAAAAARAMGARVTLLCKAPAGLANCTAYAGGGFTLGVEGVTPERHRTLTWETGRFMSQPHLLDVFSAEAPRRVQELRQYGVGLDVRRGGARVAGHAPPSGPGGMGMTLPLVRWAREHGVQIRDRAVVTHLCLDDAGISGVEYVDLVSGEISHLVAGAVVVATGGAGRLYGRTDNPVRTTGDGYALLYAAGLPLLDMEFVQFYPLGFAEEGLPTWFIPLNILDYTYLTNSAGERFLDPQLRSWGISSGREANLFARDRCAVAVARELEGGRQVFLHLEALTPHQWRDPLPADLRRYFPAHRDPASGPVRVAPVQHYFSGGVAINDRGETEIPGLLACGEVTGGVDGANRIGGNALTNITVFGLRAGEAAAAHGRSRLPQVREPAGPVPGATGTWVARWCSQQTDISPAGVKRRLNAVADRLLGPLRSGAGLKEALRAIDEISADFPLMTVRNRRDLLDALEVRNLAVVAELVARAALAREESRGVHFRSDFPHEDPAWQRHICLRAPEVLPP